MTYRLQASGTTETLSRAAGFVEDFDLDRVPAEVIARAKLISWMPWNWLCLGRS